MDLVLKNDFLNERIREWLEVALATPRSPEPIGIHVNQLLQQQLDLHTVIEASLQIFRVLIQQAESITDVFTYMPTLVIPLVCSKQLITGPFDETSLVQEVDTFEPPSLYLIKRDIIKYLTREERYVCPLNLSLDCVKSFL